MEPKTEKKFFVFKIIPFEEGAANFHNPEQDTCHQQSVCYQTPLRFQISLREKFSKSSPLRVMKKYDETSLMQISEVFGTLYHVDRQKKILNGAFKSVV